MGSVTQFRSIKNMVTKVITIPKVEVFNNLYAAFIGGGNAAGNKKKELGSPGSVARTERRIKAKLHEISDDNKEAREKDATLPPRKLKGESAKLVLTADEYKMLTTYVDCVEWLTSGCDDVADLYDALDGASTEEVA